MLQKIIYSIFVFLSSKFSNFYVFIFRIIFGRTCYGTTVDHWHRLWYYYMWLCVEMVLEVVFFYLKSGSRKMMKRYGPNVLPCNIVPLVIWVGGVAPKWLPWKEVMKFV
jgi:hypothetical protein